MVKEKSKTNSAFIHQFIITKLLNFLCHTLTQFLHGAQCEEANNVNSKTHEYKINSTNII